MTGFFSIIGLLICAYHAEPVDYYSYSTTEFFEIEEVNEPVNHQEVNRELLEAAVFFASNEARVNLKKSEYQVNGVLRKSSRLQAEYMEKWERVEHYNRTASRYHSPFKRTQAFGGNFSSVAENLARVSIFILGKNGEFFADTNGRFLDSDGKPLKTHTYASLAREVVGGWLKSKGHRENLEHDFEFLGTGVSMIAKNKMGIPEIYFVQNFANP